MKKLLSLAFIALFSTTAFAQSELPNTTIKNLSNGKKVAFNSTFEAGKVTVVNFWATWCVPCMNEIKHMRKNLPAWQQELDFNYMTVSLDESRNESLVKGYAKSQGWNFPAFIDPNSDLKRSLNFQNVPFTIIVDKSGKVAWTHTGYEEGGELEVWEKVKEIAAQ